MLKSTHGFHCLHVPLHSWNVSPPALSTRNPFVDIDRALLNRPCDCPSTPLQLFVKLTLVISISMLTLAHVRQPPNHHSLGHVHWLVVYRLCIDGYSTIRRLWWGATIQKICSSVSTALCLLLQPQNRWSDKVISIIAKCLSTPCHAITVVGQEARALFPFCGTKTKIKFHSRS